MSFPLQASDSVLLVESARERTLLYREILKLKPTAHFQIGTSPRSIACRIEVPHDFDGLLLVQTTEVQFTREEIQSFQNEHCYFSIYLMSSQILFKSKCDGPGKDGKIRFVYPSSIYKVHRRKHMRIEVKIQTQIPSANFSSHHQGSVKEDLVRSLVDLSLGGARLELLSSDKKLMGPGIILKDLLLLFPNHPIQVDGQIRYLFDPNRKGSRADGVCYAGLQFQKLKSADLEWIKQYLKGELHKRFGKELPETE